MYALGTAAGTEQDMLFGLLIPGLPALCPREASFKHMYLSHDSTPAVVSGMYSNFWKIFYHEGLPNMLILYHPKKHLCHFYLRPQV